MSLEKGPHHKSEGEKNDSTTLTAWCVPADTNPNTTNVLSCITVNHKKKKKPLLLRLFETRIFLMSIKTYFLNALENMQMQ